MTKRFTKTIRKKLKRSEKRKIRSEKEEDKLELNPAKKIIKENIIESNTSDIAIFQSGQENDLNPVLDILSEKEVFNDNTELNKNKIKSPELEEFDKLNLEIKKAFNNYEEKIDEVFKGNINKEKM